MNLLAAHFPDWLLWLGNGLAIVLLLRAALQIPWFALSQAALTGWFGATTLILLLWQLRTGIMPGVSFHLLGASALALIAGAPRAMLGMAVIVLADTSQGHGDFAAAGLSWLLSAWLPILLTSTALRLAVRHLPQHFFIYIFVNCFAVSALGMWLAGLATCSLLTLVAAHPGSDLFAEQFPFYFLLGFPEAFTTGLNLTMLVIWRPQWVVTFSDAMYLHRK
ncbi:energy-coupling factor ABC transporter permease [Chitinilyticum litopenaei]|uniref:energy-coupling factor ABC transporter permease n=1 Tax=Chitinilyticum litopenaei TaxID=1121276 RepID=UPI0003FF1E9F|nr:energy-coupling factor ABC transporter permease [Chitinilyticum litopenaei]